MTVAIAFVIGGVVGVAAVLAYLDLSNPDKKLQRAEADLAMLRGREQREAEQRARERELLEQRVKELREKAKKKSTP